MESDIRAFERTTKRYSNIDLQNKDPIELLKIKIGAFIYNNDNLYGKHNTDNIIEIFHNVIDKLPKVKAKSLNYACFILGNYICDNNKINKERLKNINKFTFQDTSFNKIDVIRYARFWINWNKDDNDVEKDEKEDEYEDDEYEKQNYVIDENEDEDNNFEEDEEEW